MGSAAAQALGRLGRPSQAVLARLLAAFQAASEWVRSSPAETPNTLNDPTEPAPAELLAALRDSDPDVRSSAAWALGELGRPREARLVRLLEALRDAEVRRSAGTARPGCLPRQLQAAREGMAGSAAPAAGR